MGVLRRILMTEEQAADAATTNLIKQVERSPEGRALLAAMPDSTWELARQAEQREMARQAECRRTNTIHTIG